MVVAIMDWGSSAPSLPQQEQQQDEQSHKPWDPNNEQHTAKVMRVKALQKLKGGPAVWDTFVDHKGGGKRDPNYRTASFLDAFLTFAAFVDIEGGNAWGDRMLGPSPLQEAVARTKQLQKVQEGRDQWHAFIERLGGGKRDPIQRSLAELNAFLAEADPHGYTANGKTAAMADRLQGVDKHTSKYQPTSPEHAHAIARVKVIQREEGGMDLWHDFVNRVGSGKRDPAAYEVIQLLEFLRESDPSNATACVEAAYSEEATLWTKVKQGQRQSDPFKEAWWKFCHEHGNDVRDPMRHDADYLKRFLEVAPAIVSPVDNCEEHKALVNEIKMGQRTSDEYKEQWYAHCEEHGSRTHDPAKHDKPFLRDFIASLRPVWEPLQRSNQEPQQRSNHRGKPY